MHGWMYTVLLNQGQDVVKPARKHKKKTLQLQEDYDSAMEKLRKDTIAKAVLISAAILGMRSSLVQFVLFRSYQGTSTWNH